MDNSFRYIVGIDLGTSSCALSYIDRYAKSPEVKTLPITQWQEHGLQEHEILPSFCYVLKNKEKGKYKLPFSEISQDYVIGSFARDSMKDRADFIVHSAKSWLCHGGVDREAKILPWHSDSIVGEKRLSPVEVSSLYLEYLKDIWNKNVALGREDFFLEKQKVVITVPASFDETASYLTIQASKIAKYGEDLSLCEEPQAAFYYCLSKRKEAFEKDKKVLVVDIGGGTSDFSLFKSFQSLSGEVQLERIAVSEHILLGGDNIDLALVHMIEKQLKEKGLPQLQGEKWAYLVSESRKLKEKVLSDGDQESAYHMTLSLASGSRLIGQTHTVTLQRHEILQTILEGFFPLCGKGDFPDEDLALKEWGLPYAKESAFTKHLSKFLQKEDVDYVLYTGGTLVPSLLRERLTGFLSQYSPKPLKILPNDALDLAVSKGASVYAYHKVHKLESVRSGYPRSLYIKVYNSEKKEDLYLCVVPKGYEGLEVLRLKVPGLQVLLGQLVSFELWNSLHRPEDKLGDFVSFDHSSMKKVCTLQNLLGKASKKQKKSIPVSLELRLSASGLLEVFCVPDSEEISEVYDLQFALDAKENLSEKIAKEEAKPHSRLEEAQTLIRTYYGKPKGSERKNPKGLVNDLEKCLGIPRKEWDLQLLRSLWEVLEEGMHRRIRTENHESAWLHLGGFLLRPGYGEQRDPIRIRKVQEIWNQGLSFQGSAKIRDQWWIFWRRIAGGLSFNLQQKIFQKVYPTLKRKEYTPEILLLLGSLERVEMQKKMALAQWLTSEILNSAMYREQKIWALMRVLNRCPLYGGPECIMRPQFVISCLSKLLPMDLSVHPNLMNLFINSSRKLEDRELDLPEEWRKQVLGKVAEKASPKQKELLESYVPQDLQNYTLLLGDSAPAGLRLV